MFSPTALYTFAVKENGCSDAQVTKGKYTDPEVDYLRLNCSKAMIQTVRDLHHQNLQTALVQTEFMSANSIVSR